MIKKIIVICVLFMLTIILSAFAYAEKPQQSGNMEITVYCLRGVEYQFVHKKIDGKKMLTPPAPIYTPDGKLEQCEEEDEKPEYSKSNNTK